MTAFARYRDVAISIYQSPPPNFYCMRKDTLNPAGAGKGLKDCMTDVSIFVQCQQADPISLEGSQSCHGIVVDRVFKVNREKVQSIASKCS